MMASSSVMMLLVAVVVVLTGSAAGFCPYGCGCDETNSRVTCIRSDLEVSYEYAGMYSSILLRGVNDTTDSA